MSLRWKGVVTNLYTALSDGEPMQAHRSVNLVEGIGIAGDRYATNRGYYSDRPEPGRQITLFETETLVALKRDHDVTLSPGEHRRNVTVQNVPLNHLVGVQFWLGEALLEATRLSTPCKHIEDITGKVVAHWLINRSGLNCIIVKGGKVSVGNELRPA